MLANMLALALQMKLGNRLTESVLLRLDLLESPQPLLLLDLSKRSTNPVNPEAVVAAAHLMPHGALTQNQENAAHGRTPKQAQRFQTGPGSM